MTEYCPNIKYRFCVPLRRRPREREGAAAPGVGGPPPHMPGGLAVPGPAWVVIGGFLGARIWAPSPSRRAVSARWRWARRGSPGPCPASPGLPLVASCSSNRCGGSPGLRAGLPVLKAPAGAFRSPGGPPALALLAVSVAPPGLFSSLGGPGAPARLVPWWGSCVPRSVYCPAPPLGVAPVVRCLGGACRPFALAVPSACAGGVSCSAGEV